MHAVQVCAALFSLCVRSVNALCACAVRVHAVCGSVHLCAALYVLCACLCAVALALFVAVVLHHCVRCRCGCLPQQAPLRLVQLRVHSNGGRDDHTCVYRFRVHGRPAPVAPAAAAAPGKGTPTAAGGAAGGSTGSNVPLK